MDTTSQTQNHTIFVGNIDHSLKREDLLHLLFELYTPYGNIIEIKINRQDKVTKQKGRNKTTGELYQNGMRYMKTIAFIVFDSIQSAGQALKTNRFPFFGRELYVQYARTKSDSIALLDASHPYAKKQIRNNNNTDANLNGNPLKKQKTDANSNQNGQNLMDDEDDDGINPSSTGASALEADKKIQIVKKQEYVNQLKKRALMNMGKDGGDVDMEGRGGGESNRVIVGGLGDWNVFTEEIMKPLFEQFPGLSTYEHLLQQEGFLKLTFEETSQAAQCIEELHGFNVDGRHVLSMKFGPPMGTSGEGVVAA